MPEPAKTNSILTTRRTVLRPLEPSDEGSLYLLRSDAGVNRFISRPMDINRAATRAFITRIRTGMKLGKWMYWSICEKETGELLGTACVWNFSHDRICAEIGYELFPVFQGQGIMQEVLKVLIGYCADELKLKTLEAFTHEDNLRSARLLEKNGFLRNPEKKDQAMERNVIFSLRLHDHCN